MFVECIKALSKITRLQCHPEGDRHAGDGNKVQGVETPGHLPKAVFTAECSNQSGRKHFSMKERENVYQGVTGRCFRGWCASYFPCCARWNINWNGMKIPPPVSHPFPRQAGWESACLVLKLLLALQGKTPAWSFQQMKNLIHLSSTFRIKTLLSILSWILITSCLEFLSDWICEMRALLTSPHCSFHRGNLCTNTRRCWWASGRFPEGWQFGQSAQTSPQHTWCQQDIICPVHIQSDATKAVGCWQLPRGDLLSSGPRFVLSGKPRTKRMRRTNAAESRFHPNIWCLWISVEMAVVHKTSAKPGLSGQWEGDFKLKGDFAIDHQTKPVH